jgi:hypothetical protein
MSILNISKRGEIKWISNGITYMFFEYDTRIAMKYNTCLVSKDIFSLFLGWVSGYLKKNDRSRPHWSLFVSFWRVHDTNKLRHKTKFLYRMCRKSLNKEKLEYLQRD